MDLKYKHLMPRKDDQVCITVFNPETGWPFIAEGPVQSSYSKYVYEKDSYPNSPKCIGEEPAGIEMTNKRTNKPCYWKAGDGGLVELLIGDEYVQVYPKTFEGIIP